MALLNDEIIRKLASEALSAREFSYSPYSKYRVGAALLTSSGRIFRGCNIENSAYPVTVCAERTAIFSAVASGEKDFCAIAVAGSSEHCVPCGSCLQVMSEFCNADFPVISVDSADKYYIHKLGELLPFMFSLNNK